MITFSPLWHISDLSSFNNFSFILKTKFQQLRNEPLMAKRVPSARNLNLKFLKFFQTITSKFHALHKIFDTY